MWKVNLKSLQFHHWLISFLHLSFTSEENSTLSWKERICYEWKISWTNSYFAWNSSGLWSQLFLGHWTLKNIKKTSQSIEVKSSVTKVQLIWLYPVAWIRWLRVIATWSRIELLRYISHTILLTNLYFKIWIMLN